MPFIDIIIAVAIIVSIVVGFVRGIVKEGVSIGALVFAIWGALYFGPVIGGIAKGWLSAEEARVWLGRIVVFTIILSLGGLASWGLSKVIRVSVLSGIDRMAGSLFGALRGILFAAIFVLIGEFAGFSNDEWWADSHLIPHFAVVADWVEEFAPKGLDMITPDGEAESLPVELPEVFK
ncbi:MAG: CvpA family protein [Woeseiaceae bacterium]|nr:CvpA family protein [Woeseiaceae bacterium]